jgi:hypothetical protein
VKRRRIVPVCIILAFAVSILALRVAGRGPVPCPVDVRPETAERLEVGMTEGEIEAILGGPAGDYRTRNDIGYFFGLVGGYSNTLHELDKATEKQWNTDQYSVLVFFDPHGKAARIYGAGAYKPPSMPELLLSKIKRLLGGN